MNAGFAKVDITPPLGIPMMGTSAAMDRPAQGVRDPLFVRALFVEQDGQRALILGFDVCFLGREGSDRLKALLGLRLGFEPRQILLNASHNHAGPALGLFYDLRYVAPQWDYLRQLDEAVFAAASAAIANSVEARLEAGAGRSRLSISRRLPRNGRILNAPNPQGTVYETLPVALFRNARTDRPVCLLFAGTGHPTAMQEPRLTAEFPGAAMNRLDAHLGVPCSLFLQGPGGDSRPRNLAQRDRPVAAVTNDESTWQRGWDFSDPDAKIEEAGETLAAEVMAVLKTVLHPVPPVVRTALIETHWPLQPPNRAEYEAILARPAGDPTKLHVHREWAKRQLALMAQGRQIRAASVLLQGVQLGDGVRLVALEGEPVAAHGHAMERAWTGGVTFALGYTNGDALYLVTSPMLDEGGYEVDSYWQYDFPSPLAKGMERVLEQRLQELKTRGVQ